MHSQNITTSWKDQQIPHIRKLFFINMKLSNYVEVISGFNKKRRSETNIFLTLQESFFII
jgi:hypothetical protein